MSDLQDWQNAVEMMFCASVVPGRSVGRIRRAIADGRSVEPYLQDIEEGMARISEVYNFMDDRPAACPACLGTGHVLGESS